MRRGWYILHCVGVSESKDSGKTNEDAYWFDEKKGIVIVADGLGGQNAGEIASDFVVKKAGEYLSSFWNNLSENYPCNSSLISSLIKKGLQECVLMLNDSLVKKSYEDPRYREMGSTIVIGFLWQDTMHFVNSGDSRAYIIDSKKIKQITEDHSFVASLLRKGKLTEDEARQHSNRHILLSHLGLSHQELMFSLKMISLKFGDRILFCTDGLTDVLSDYEIYEEVKKDATIQTICERLITLVNKKGRIDDITVVLAEFNKNIDQISPGKKIRKHYP